MADRELDELFGEGGGHPTPRLRLALTLLVVGLVLTLLGMACTAAPGGLVVLAAWLLVEKDLDRVDSGFLPADLRPRLVSVHRVINVAVGFVVLLFLVQLFLLCTGVYDTVWSTLIGWLFGATSPF